GTFLRRDLRHARRVGARRRERLPELGERQPGAAPGPARGAGRRARPPGLPGGDGGRGARGGRRAPRARGAERARARHPPRRLGVVLLPRSGRQPDPGPLPARDRGVSEARPLRTVAAWGVHLLTASSAPAGVLAILAAERGNAAAAMGWMAYTVAIDSIDGTLARAVGVKQVLPFFDGTRLDDIVDYFTYVIVPMLFVLRFDLLPPALAVPVALCPVLASAYGFCRTDAKTADHYFTGFPSYWTIVAVYLYPLALPRPPRAAHVSADRARLAAGVLLVPEGAPEPVAFAAAELGTYLGRMFGREPARRSAAGPGGSWLCLAPEGTPVPERALAVPGGAELVVRPADDAAMVSGVSPRALVAGVYALLEAAGCRWSPDGSSGEHVPGPDAALRPVR